MPLAIRQVTFLGHDVSANGLAPYSSKVAAIEALPEPTNIKELRSFLGVTSYFRRYVLDYATLAEPLVKLTRENVPSESPELTPQGSVKVRGLA